ncbi:pseudaminic acid cytidylyltransferase [Pseudomonas sp. V1]|uniref:pseudaminic acid cytidylyltransferase n=1 Tax=Pseudomonas arcuscaelestis TaxID=2710591 RepID=UPI00193F8789|nr:pseudaminic acid cytidylyltransferase [Pseudomonas arcuscaelestis]MBM3106683.1 pseudaminic acid cytidylyltransferase [Pseudomonas arcuscaelestis]
MRLAVIPARGGSKRIPRKNIKMFCGKPMIAWSIEAALASGCFDKVIVSTDDDEIVAVARAWGAEVPFVRPKSLADDHTGTLPVIRHAIEFIQSTGVTLDQVCCIYATAPFVTPRDLQSGCEALSQSGASYAFSIASYAFPIQRAIRLDAKGRVSMFQSEHFATRSQDLEDAYHDAGQFYWGKTSAWKAELPLFTQDSIGISLPRHRVQDIDTPEDWERAEWMFRAMQVQALETRE